MKRSFEIFSSLDSCFMNTETTLKTCSLAMKSFDSRLMRRSLTTIKLRRTYSCGSSSSQAQVISWQGNAVIRLMIKAPFKQLSAIFFSVKTCSDVSGSIWEVKKFRIISIKKRISINSVKLRKAEKPEKPKAMLKFLR